MAFTGVVAALTATPADRVRPRRRRPDDTELIVTVDPGDSVPDEWSLTCDPPGGAHPDPEAACAVLADLDSDVIGGRPG